MKYVQIKTKSINSALLSSELIMFSQEVLSAELIMPLSCPTLTYNILCQVY